MQDTYDDLQQSYGRCLRAGGFIERFYDIFLSSHPDIGPMFAKTDFQQQRMALRRGISAAISHAAGSSLSRRTVEQMAQSHSSKGRTPVRPDLYPYWIDSLIAAVQEFDAQANPALLRRWREAMGMVTKDFSARF